MDSRLQDVVNNLKARYSGVVREFRGEVTVLLEPEHLIPAFTCIKDEFGFDMLEAETAVDYWPQTSPRFHVVYQLYSMEKNIQLRIRVPLDGNAPTLPTIERIFPNANWHEREIWDMFGIRFDGHSDPRRLLMPADWQGHPLRKDYPLGYEEVQFDFNAEEIMVHKPRPEK
ncbi:NADH-quinone oxidoreductase subunit C [Leptolinea tardivitalis]|uniref:NADH-quinone oxidoreductase subunit C n=1 Tax=Leptolinea tardivitalis TaxID=229920 RepID=A0A0P6X8N2_9CHLR|nr:NADH-quinone oxidoreductase subunit C [Leptolinea tardivitalis]KPL70601.1 NADH-quinone oxidoreductase subunit C [Leptolinea tardivitalis]GAP22214.1 NADH dehydrogenase subunit C [Leptolinea tardivitalis]